MSYKCFLVCTSGLIKFRRNDRINDLLSCLYINQSYLLQVWALKIYALVGNIKNDLVKYFMQHIRNGLFIDLINT